MARLGAYESGSRIRFKHVQTISNRNPQVSRLQLFKFWGSQGAALGLWMLSAPIALPVASASHWADFQRSQRHQVRLSSLRVPTGNGLCQTIWIANWLVLTLEALEVPKSWTQLCPRSCAVMFRRVERHVPRTGTAGFVGVIGYLKHSAGRVAEKAGNLVADGGRSFGFRRSPWNSRLPFCHLHSSTNIGQKGLCVSWRCSSV